MDEVSETAAPAAKLDEAKVAAFLKADPQFLTRHLDVLEFLELTHVTGTAVSLIERQVELLRGKNAQLESRLERMLENARDNESRADRTLRLALILIRSPSLAAVAAGLRTSMREDFGLDDAFIGISSALFKRHDIEGVVPVDPGGAIARAYDNFLRTRLIECGPIDEERSKLLFPKATVPMASAAVVPLEKDKHLGMIALGSRDPARFQPRQGKLFLEMVAELVSAAIRVRLNGGM